jgi:cation transport protein ChaC
VNAVDRPLRLPPPPEALQLRDAAWRQESIHRTLAHWDGHSDLWIFGYGSLIWRTDFTYLESRIGRIHGYHRSLCLWSRVNRGTPEQPGLVFSLGLGGSCAGRAYRVAGESVSDIMPALWAREMPSAAYIPRWLQCRTPQGTVPALVFTMDRSDDSYAPGLSLEQTLSVVRQGQGRYGPCLDYVLQTADALDAAGIVDPRLRTLARALRLPTSSDLPVHHAVDC